MFFPSVNANAFDDIKKDFTIKLYPSVPAPYQEVRAEIVSFSFNVDSSYVIWRVNGIKELEGVGEKSLSFKAGGPGITTSVAVSLLTKAGDSFAKTIKITPVDADLLWSANTYTPPYYKGKRLSAVESDIVVSALVIGGRNRHYNPSELIYDWKLNGKKLVDKSGTGRNSLKINIISVYKDNLVSVSVKDFQGNMIAKKSLMIENVFPKVVFYKEDPVEGVLFNQSIGGELKLSGKQFLFRAEPYFLPFIKGVLSDLFVWHVEGQRPETNRNGLLDIRIGDEAQRGTDYRVSVEVVNLLSRYFNKENPLKNSLLLKLK